MTMLSHEIETEECEYLKNYQLPVLVLATKRKYDFKPGREWLSIVHKTRGQGHNKHYMAGTILEPKKDIRIKLNMINKTWLDSGCGFFSPPTLEQLLTYRDQLKTLLQVDCNDSFSAFEEGIYPIDCTPENIKKLTQEQLPEELDDLIDYKSAIDFLGSMIRRWNLYILGENHD